MAYDKKDFVDGEWNVICDVCRNKVKSSSVKRQWDGLIVCENDWEPTPATRQLKPDGLPNKIVQKDPETNTFLLDDGSDRITLVGE